MRILIIGCTGQLGFDMTRCARAAAHEVRAVDYPEVDITDLRTLRGPVGEFDPELIINCSAYTNVDLCETHPREAYAVNADGVENLGRCASTAGAPVVHIGTDYVFDGGKNSGYTETDTPCPATVYGQSKLEGERRLLETQPRSAIFRIAWLYGSHGTNFVKTIRSAALRNAGSGESLRVVDDQHGSPTYTVHVCRQILSLLPPREFGVFHCTSEGDCTWYEFARCIVASYGIDAAVEPCTTAEYPRPAPRPRYSILENRRLNRMGANRMEHWEKAFEEFRTEEKTLPPHED